MGIHKDITVHRIYNNRLIAAGGSHWSDIERVNRDQTGIVDLGDFAQVGSFSVQLALSGSGILDLDYYLSHDRKTFVIPSKGSSIINGFTSTSGSNADGKDIIEFSPEFSRFIKFLATESGGANSITLTMDFAVQ